MAVTWSLHAAGAPTQAVCFRLYAVVCPDCMALGVMPDAMQQRRLQEVRIVTADPAAGDCSEAKGWWASAVLGLVCRGRKGAGYPACMAESLLLALKRDTTRWCPGSPLCAHHSPDRHTMHTCHQAVAEQYGSAHPMKQAPRGGKRRRKRHHGQGSAQRLHI